MAEKAEGMNALNEVTAGAKVGQPEGDQQTANSGKAEEEGKLNEVNSQYQPASIILHSLNIYNNKKSTWALIWIDLSKLKEGKNASTFNRTNYEVDQADELDMVIRSHKLQVERLPDYKENSGNCWYASIAMVINKLVEEGRVSLNELNLETGGLITHQDVRAAVTNFMESSDCSMADYWIDHHFGGSHER